jgi:hypothetical protein
MSGFPRNVVEGRSLASTEFLHLPLVEFHTVTEAKSFYYLEVVREVRQEVILLITLSRMTRRNCTDGSGLRAVGRTDPVATHGFSLQSKES